jgi:hypothetical protein
MGHASLLPKKVMRARHVSAFAIVEAFHANLTAYTGGSELAMLTHSSP